MENESRSTLPLARLIALVAKSSGGPNEHPRPLPTSSWLESVASGPCNFNVFEVVAGLVTDVGVGDEVAVEPPELQPTPQTIANNPTTSTSFM